MANGATQVVPGSHLWDPERQPTAEEVVYAEMSAVLSEILFQVRIAHFEHALILAFEDFLYFSYVSRLRRRLAPHRGKHVPDRAIRSGQNNATASAGAPRL